MALPYEVEKTDKNALIVKMQVRKGWKQLFLLTADRHHDNIHCRQDLEKKHLKKAKERGAGIIDVGDLFCAMQGKYDPRSNKSSCRPEHQTGKYLDRLVDTACEFYAPYAENFIALGYGNHEMSIEKRHETSLTDRLATGLNKATGSNIHSLGYTGWIKFAFVIQKTRCASKRLWYTHGSGGGGPVTEDIIQSSRQRVYIENADIMLSAHVHRSWLQEIIKLRINERGHIERVEGWYIKTPTYKDGYGTGETGFEVEKNHGPRPLGAWWLEFFYEDDTIKMRPYKAAN